MTTELISAIGLTIGISALCSTLEAMILSVTSAEIENLKTHLSAETFWRNLDPK